MAEAFAEAYRSMRGDFSKTVDWGVHVVSDGLLTTGQNRPHQALLRKACSSVLPSLASGERFARRLDSVKRSRRAKRTKLQLERNDL
jgi:hypothetical protein